MSTLCNSLLFAAFTILSAQGIRHVTGVPVNGSAVLPPPRFTEEPEEVTYIVRSQPASLRCRAVQAVQVNFRCRGSWINPLQHIRSEGIDPSTKLRYLEASIDDLKEQLEETGSHNGFWCQCYAWRTSDQATADPTVSRRANVRVAYLRKHFEPHGPVSTSVGLGSTVLLQCYPPDGDPIPQISWQKNGETLNVRDDVNYIISNEGNLIVSMARLTDMANYSCVAENLASRRVSEPAFINVFEDGQWSSWSSWSVCAEDCRQHRRRLCDSPSPSNGGNYCDGSDLDTLNCTAGSCNGAVDMEDDGFGGFRSGHQSAGDSLLLNIGVPLMILAIVGLVVLVTVLFKRRTSLRTSNTKGQPDVTKPALTNMTVTYDKISSGYSTIDETPEVTAPLFQCSRDGQPVQFARVTSGGGKISLPRSGVSLVVPEGAVSKGQTVDIFLGVLRDDQDRPKLLVGQTMLSPVVICGPEDVVLHRPVLVSFCHCASLRDSRWLISVYSRDRLSPSPQWKLLTTMPKNGAGGGGGTGGGGGGNCPVRVDDHHCYLLTDRLMHFALIGQKSMPGWAMKFLRLALFCSATITSPEVLLRLYVVDDTVDAIEGVFQVECGLGGHLLGDTKQMTCHSGGANLCVAVQDLTDGWTCRQSSGYQEIPLSHIWSGTHNTLHCSFTLDQMDASRDCLTCNISVRQQNVTSCIQVLPVVLSLTSQVRAMA